MAFCNRFRVLFIVALAGLAYGLQVQKDGPSDQSFSAASADAAATAQADADYVTEVRKTAATAYAPITMAADAAGKYVAAIAGQETPTGPNMSAAPIAKAASEATKMVNGIVAADMAAKNAAAALVAALPLTVDPAAQALVAHTAATTAMVADAATKAVVGAALDTVIRATQIANKIQSDRYLAKLTAGAAVHGFVNEVGDMVKPKKKVTKGSYVTQAAQEAAGETWRPKAPVYEDPFDEDIVFETTYGDFQPENEVYMSHDTSGKPEATSVKSYHTKSQVLRTKRTVVNRKRRIYTKKGLVPYVPLPPLEAQDEYGIYGAYLPQNEMYRSHGDGTEVPSTAIEFVKTKKEARQA